MTLSRRPEELPNILLGHTHRSTADAPTPAAIDAVVSAYRAIHHICGARKGDHLVGINNKRGLCPFAPLPGATKPCYLSRAVGKISVEKGVAKAEL